MSPSLCPVPRPPSPRIPDPTTIVHCLGSLGSAVSTDQLGIINHGTMVRKEEKHCPPVGVHHMLDASSPLSLPSIPPPPPLTWAEDPSRSVRLMPLS